MKEQRQSDPEQLPDMVNPPRDIELILLSGRIGIIAHELSKRLHIDGMRALDLFYESETCANLHNKKTGLYLYGDRYIADEFCLEMQRRQ